MNINTLKSQNPQLINRVAEVTHLSREEITEILNCLFPAISKGLKTVIKRDQKLARDLFTTLEEYDEQLRLYAENPDRQKPEEIRLEGENFLGLIFRDKDISRNVADKISARTHIESRDIRESLPYLATTIMSIFTQLLHQKGLQGHAWEPSKRELDTQAKALLLEFFDADKEGSVLDDLMGKLDKFLGRGETRH